MNKASKLLNKKVLMASDGEQTTGSLTLKLVLRRIAKPVSASNSKSNLCIRLLLSGVTI